jgi:cytochrome c peroxidase
MQTINAAYFGALYWNGRNDSLWSQIVAVAESPVSVGGSRLRAAWRIADAYRAEYQAIFGALPAELDSVAAQRARLEADGTCRSIDGACPAPHCHVVRASAGDGIDHCLPRFPLEGRPGFELVGQAAVCSWGKVPPSEADLQTFGDAYDCMELADQLAITQIYVNFAKAIAAYEYRLLSTSSPYDAWVEGGMAEAGAGLSVSAQRGARLFVGKAACASCHSGAMLSDGDFHNIGVPQVGAYVPTLADCPAGGWCDCVSDDRTVPTNCLPWGARDGLRKLAASRFRRDSRWSDDLDCANHFTLHIDANYAATHPDECDGLVGLYSRVLGGPRSQEEDDELMGAWRTPSLRNVAQTAPYMHTGAYATLAEVIEHYDRGGRPDPASPPPPAALVGRRDSRMQPLNLTATEKLDLERFLQSLSAPADPAWAAPPPEGSVPPPSGF